MLSSCKQEPGLHALLEYFLAPRIMILSFLVKPKKGSRAPKENYLGEPMAINGV